MTAAPPCLVTDALSVRFGGVIAVDELSISVPRGELVGLIGPNGAGKTTFIDAVSGFVPSTGGLRFLGTDIAGLAVHDRARLGMARTFQSVELFEDLTVLDNVRVATEHPGRWTVLADCVRPHRGELDDAVTWALDAVDLGHVAARRPGELSLGHRKLVGIARALAARPALVLLDEPAAGLDSAESHLLGDRLRGLLDHGISALLVDHDMSLVLGSCDWVHVIDHGRSLVSGLPSDIAHDERVVEAYLGPGATVEVPTP